MPNIISLVSFLISKVQSGEIYDESFFQKTEKLIDDVLNKKVEVKRMGVLSDLLDELRSGDDDETIRKLCDKIYEEEKKNISNLTIIPTGSNIFLALECPEDFQKYNFVCLEREEKNEFIVSHWAVMKKDTLSNISGPAPAKRIKVWPCSGLPNQKIVEKFLEKYNFLRGK